MCLFICTYIHTYIHTHTHKYIHTYIHTYIQVVLAGGLGGPLTERAFVVDDDKKVHSTFSSDFTWYIHLSMHC